MKIMKINPKTRFLENIAEISHMLMSDNNFQGETDSAIVRKEAILAALAFDKAEKKAFKKAKEDWKYEWMDATEEYVRRVADGVSYSELEKVAAETIRNAGLE